VSLYQTTHHRPMTIERMEQLLRELAEILGPGATTAGLTTATVVAWMNRYPQRSPNTVIGYQGYLCAMCAWAFEEGWLERVPSWRRLKPRAVPAATAHALPWLDVVALLGWLRSRTAAWTDRRLYALVATVAYTGLRRDEALFLRVRDVDLTAGFFTLADFPERPLKAPSAGQPVPICPELTEILVAWLPEAGPAWLFPGVRRRSAWHGGRSGHRPIDHLRRAAEAAAIPTLGWHDLRHTWATHAETRWNFEDAAIQRVMRHLHPITTQRYRHADLANLSRIARQITYRA
jgi:integrase